MDHQVRTLDDAETFHGMGKCNENTGWCWNIPWDGHSEHWMVLEHSMGWAFKTLDGAGTFHVMDIIGVATPGTKHRKATRREITATLELPSSICHWPTRRCCRTSLLRTKARYSAFLGRYPGPYPGWSRMLHSVCDGIYPGQSTFLSYP